MKRKVEVQMPIGGISKVAARGKQPRATTHDALNVRGIDPRDGRVRMARRAGTVDVVREPFRGGRFGIPQPIRFGHVGQYFQPTDDFSLLDGEDWSVEYSKALLADGVAITIGFDGRIYVLDSTGRVVIFDNTGAQVGYVPSPVPYGMSLLRRIATDESGAVYIGASGTISVDGRASEIYRITQPAQEDDRMSVSWAHPIVGKLVDFTVRSGTLAYLYDAIDSEVDDTFVAYLGALESGLPVVYASGETALGAWRVELNKFGDAIIAAPRDTRRGSSVFDTPQVSWTPRELAAWDDDVFFWIDAAQPKEDGTNWVNGDPVTEIPDVRHYESDFGETNDTVERTLSEYSGFGYDDARVTWEASAFGLSPAFVINRGGMLRTGYSSSGTLTDQLGIFPVDGADGKWSAFFLMQVPSGTSGGERLITQYAGTARWGISIESSSGNITAYIGTAGGGLAYDANIAMGSAPTGFNSMALIRIDYDPAGAGPMTLFVNGESIGSTNVGSLAAWGSFTANGSSHANPITTIGAGVNFAAGYLTVTSIEDWPNPYSGSSAVIQKNDTVSCDVAANNEVAGMEIRSLDTGFRNATMFRVEADNVSSAFGAITFSQVFSKASGSFRGIYRFLFERPITERYIRIVLLESVDTSSTGTWRINEIRLYSSVDEDSVSQGSLIHLHEAIVVRNGISAGDALRVEGYLAWKVGGGAFLSDAAGSGAGTHTYSAAPPVGTGDVELDLLVLAQVATSDAMIVKHDTTGTLMSVVTETRLGNGGIGYGLAIDEDGSIYTCGAPLTPISSNGPSYVKLVDSGSQFTLTGGFMQSAASTEYQPILDAGKPVPMRVDSAGFVSRALPDGRLVRTSKGGELKSSYGIDSFPWEFAFPSTSPQYGSSPDCGPEFIYAFGSQSFDKIRMVARTASGRMSTRQTRYLAVAGDTLFTFDGTSPATTPDGTQTFVGTDPIFGETVSGETIIVDGKTIRSVDLAQNTVEAFMPEKGAGPEASSKLVALWSGRLVFANSEQDPQNWIMSASGDIRDFDEYPADGADSRAVSGNSATLIGRMPSVINAIIPINDNILVFGCQGAIYRVIGNPAAGGGIFTMSDTIGMAFGKAWCRDPRGTLYFMSDAGGIYMMSSQADSVPFGGPESLTTSSLHDEMQDIDFGSYRVHMEWSEEARGMHVFLIPLDPLELVEQPIHYFFEMRVDGQKGGAWWKDQFAHRNHQVSSAWRSNGDRPEDRVVMLGCRDGMIRQFLAEAVSDAGHPIPSHFSVGPFPGTGEGVEVKASHLEVSLASDGGAMLCHMYGSKSESMPSRPVSTVQLHPGHNPPSLARVRGNHLWFRFEGVESSPWAVEGAWVRLGVSGEAKAV